MSAVHVHLALAGHDANDRTLVELQDWLQRARIPGLRAQTVRGPVQPGLMGAELVEILEVVLASRVLVELIRSLHVWIGARRRKVTLELDFKKEKVRIGAEGNTDLNEILSQVKLAMETGRDAEHRSGSQLGDFDRRQPVPGGPRAFAAAAGGLQ